VIGCPPWGGSAVASVFEGRQRGRWRARRLQELTAGDPDVRVGGPDRRCRRQSGSGRDGVDLGGVDVPQHVVAAAPIAIGLALTPLNKLSEQSVDVVDAVVVGLDLGFPSVVHDPDRGGFVAHIRTVPEKL